MSITDSRLAVVKAATFLPTTKIIVWDWTTGGILLVRRLLVLSSTLIRTAR